MCMNMENKKKRIKIAQILNRMDNGGIEAVVLNYFRYIDKELFQFDFYFDERSLVPYREELINLGAQLFPLPPYTRQRAYQQSLIKKLKSGQYDIVHVHMNTMSFFALIAAERAGIPIRICHNHSTANWRERRRTVLKFLLRPLNRLPSTDWFACGKQAGEWMYGKKAVQDSRVFILPNAIETKRFAFSEKDRISVRSELGIGENVFVVGHVGRFMKQKNHKRLLRIFQVLVRKRPNAVLLLIGEGEMETSIRELAQKLNIENKIVFAGVRKDVHRFYSAMDTFCLPSLYEGFPVVLLETQGNGLPAVCSDRISEEVCLTNLVTRLSLEKEKLWADVLLMMKREKAVLPEIYEIRKAAELLQDKYMELLHG